MHAHIYSRLNFLISLDDALDQFFLLGNNSEFLQQINVGSTTSNRANTINSAVTTRYASKPGEHTKEYGDS
jgi:hypothetical protein